MRSVYELAMADWPLPDLAPSVTSLTPCNTAKSYVCTPESLFVPISNFEVQMIAREVAHQSRRVRAVGEHNRLSEGWATDDVRTPLLRYTQWRSNKKG
jgi:hypothetical protein